jgi:hypothetical protein
VVNLLNLPPTTYKVQKNTNKKINARIADKTLENIQKHQNSDKEAIDARIAKLNNEWDTERVLEMNFGALVSLSWVLGSTVSKKWFALGGLAGLFLVQHALQGWCPPLPIIRRLGIRTVDEIYKEKSALLILKNEYLQNQPKVK